MKDKKKYTKKYYTGGRVDMSKGGRVKAAVGGMQKAPTVSKKAPTMSIEREDIPVQPVQVGERAKSNATRIGATPSPAPQPKVTPRNNTPVPPVENRAAPTPPAPKAPPGYIQTVGGGFEKIIPNVNTSTGSTNIEKARELAQAGQPAQPSPRMEREAELQNMAGKTINVGREALRSDRPRNAQDAVEQTSQAFQQAPTTGKGSDQMFIGREGDVRPQSNFDVEDKFIGRGRDERDERDERDTGPQIGDTKKGSGLVGKFITYVWNGNNWVVQQKEDKDTDTETEPTAEELAAQEKTRRQDVARQSAEAAARGEVPEAARIPEAEQVGYERDAQGQLLLDDQGNPIPLREQQVTTMDPVTRARTDIRAEGQAPEQVTTVGEAATAKTPEQIRTETITDDDLTIVPEEAQVDFATGEVSDKAIAEAAQVDRVAPIEGAEVEIPEGALAERVVGTISEGAKATAVMNVGTSLSRITRAKKQLSRAGLSDADIEEIGNDPEALEARLADFSEEQRGIIEGLPQEALVSTQMNNLLEGIESGEIPTWARPAVAQVEQMLARRGMSASTVGRDSLFNAIIQSAMPIAQSNAQAIQQSVSQQKTIEAQTAEANAQRMQQTALTNAQNVFNMDMAQFSADQQTVLSNSKFMQTVGLTEANNEQQATIQNAVLMSQANLAEADFYQKAQIQNAQAFLQMDVQNLANEQQANVLKAQQTQQRMLSNQSAQNAAAQFNAASENQTQQFMASLNAQIDQYNTSQMNAMSQFDATQKNAAAARDANRAADVEKFNTQLETQIDQFNANQDFARNQWNAQNKAVVEQSNTQWRRNTNTANTAMQNQINAQNAQNAFAMSQTAQSFLWQELRDQADYDFRNGENEKNRIAQLVNTALASDPKKYGGSVASIEALIGAITGDLF